MLQLSTTLLFLLGATLPLCQIPFPGTSHNTTLQFFDLIAVASALCACLVFMKRPDPKLLLPLLYPVSLTISGLAGGNLIANVALLKAFYLGGIACSAATLLVFSGQHGLVKLRQGWLVGFAVVVGAALAAVLGFYLGYSETVSNPFLFHHGSLPTGTYPRVRSTFWNANLLCNYLIVTAGWLESPALLCVLILCALATLSPALGPLTWLLCLRSQKRSVKLAGWLVALAAYLISWTYPGDLFSGRLRPSSRFQCWSQAANLWQRSPIFGLGPGKAHIMVSWTTPDGDQALLTDAHNLFLSILSQGGVFTLLSLSLVTWKLRKTALPRLGMALLAALWLDGLTGSYEDARYSWVACGALLSKEE